MSETSLNKTEILTRAKQNWDSKSDANRVRAGSKYQHFLDKFKLKTNDWSNNFDLLSEHQQHVLVKGELIRTYDSLPNILKTDIMHEFGLSIFSSKWYKLPSKDKKILLNHIIK
jgi:hypothetical protein